MAWLLPDEDAFDEDYWDSVEPHFVKDIYEDLGNETLWSIYADWLADNDRTAQENRIRRWVPILAPLFKKLFGPDWRTKVYETKFRLIVPGRKNCVHATILYRAMGDSAWLTFTLRKDLIAQVQVGGYYLDERIVLGALKTLMSRAASELREKYPRCAVEPAPKRKRGKPSNTLPD